MRNFLKAFLVFLCWATVALLVQSHNFRYEDTTTPTDEIVTKSISKKKNEEPAKSSEPLKQPEEVTSKPTISEERIEKEVKSSKGQRKATHLKFKHKFITNAAHTRVLFPQNFSYFKDSIFNFLNNNPSKEIIIVGHYLPNEFLSNKTSFGESRAIYIKNRLTKYGINPNRLNIKDSLVTYSYDNDGFYAEGITVFYSEISAEKRKTLDKYIQTKTIQNTFSRNTLRPDKNLLSYAFELKNYLANNPNKMVNIIGHSNKTRNEETSKAIGLKLATQLADYLIKNGIPKSKLKTSSKGDTSPLEGYKSNNIKNKRIEILIN
ncbi:OmpA family protein [Tenacibaculum sp. MAR_2009_124]|uniref:OmpA family protein n=1 Tax=Tenacibaculum sp. MAR_2009_124 TaxID=1250059 RepID=UPI00089578BC|nr:OmpA family protein [Tenacibaculum sp. MAR_2009_124]SEB40808.1 OmpA family protein [Tenacibaculum sp. MAR_2009_124]